MTQIAGPRCLGVQAKVWWRGTSRRAQGVVSTRKSMWVPAKGHTHVSDGGYDFDHDMCNAHDDGVCESQYTLATYHQGRGE